MGVSLQTGQTEEKWDLIIRPQRNPFSLRLGELWRYRDLVMLFVRRDFVSVYKQTILGPLWYLIQPLLTTITMTFIFGYIARLPTDGLPQFLFYMSGRWFGLTLLIVLPKPLTPLLATPPCSGRFISHAWLCRSRF